MNRKFKIGFMIWVTFCIIVIAFAIFYVVRGQIQASRTSLEQLNILINTPH